LQVASTQPTRNANLSGASPVNAHGGKGLRLNEQELGDRTPLHTGRPGHPGRLLFYRAAFYRAAFRTHRIRLLKKLELLHPTPRYGYDNVGGNMRNFMIAALATMALAGCGVPTTADFVQKAAMSDMYEVQAGKLAAEKGQSDAVKQFGQQMVDAHTKTTEELTGIVKTKSLKVDLPAKLDAKHQKLIDDLNSASAQDFDKTYAKQQVDAHQEAVNLFKKYAAQGDDADVKQFAQKTLPTIEQHLEEAKKLPGSPSA
jgi:putative membrane protein